MTPSTRSDWQRIGTFALGLALAATLATACGDSSTGTTAASIEGTWTLSTVNGMSVPATLFEFEIDGVTYSEVLAAGQIQFAGGTYSGSLTLESRADGVVVDSETDSFSGDYTVSGNTVTMHDDGEEDIVGTFTASTLTVSFEDDGISFTLVFTR